MKKEVSEEIKNAPSASDADIKSYLKLGDKINQDCIRMLNLLPTIIIENCLSVKRTTAFNWKYGKMPVFNHEDLVENWKILKEEVKNIGEARKEG